MQWPRLPITSKEVPALRFLGPGKTVLRKIRTKVQFVLQPRLAPLVPSICSPIFAKRLWRFWAQELENV